MDGLGLKCGSADYLYFVAASTGLGNRLGLILTVSQGFISKAFLSVIIGFCILMRAVIGLFLYKIWKAKLRCIHNPERTLRSAESKF